MSFFSCCSKAVIVTINVLFWVLSAGLIFLGVWILTAYTKFEHLSDALSPHLLPAYVLVAVGIILFVLGTIGCVGVVRDHKCLVGLYFSFLLVAFIGLVLSVPVAYFYRRRITDSLHGVLKESLDKYDNDTGIQEAIDLMQSQLHCCGADNYTDWNDTKWHNAHKNELYPASCCVNRTCNYTYNDQPDTGLDPNLYPQGCYGKIREELFLHIVAVYAIIGVTLFMLLLGLISACVVMMHKRRAENFIYRDLSDTEGMQA